MRKVLRIYSIETFCLYVSSMSAYGIIFEKGLETLLLAGLSLTISSVVIKPVINLLLLPINLITFNLFKWVSTVVVLYITTLIVTDFKIVNFIFVPQILEFLGINGFILTGISAYIAFSLVITSISSVIYFIMR